MNGYLVSIIMPSYNTLKEELFSAIDSVVAQIYTNWELVIVDDASDSKSFIKNNKEELLNKYSNVNNSIKILHLDYPHGQAYARNFAFKNSIGDVIAYLDSDDFWNRYHLMNSLSYYEPNKVVWSPCFYVNISNTTSGDLIVTNTKKQDISNIVGNEKEILLHDNPISINSVIHSREAFIKAGGFENGVVCGEDGLLWRRLGEAGYEFVCKPEDSTVYCMRNDKEQQHFKLREPISIPAIHLHPNGNGQELDIQENLITRRKWLLNES